MKFPGACILFLSCLFLSAPEAFSQKDSARVARNNIFVEAGGAGGYGSVNYERILMAAKNVTIAVRAGLGSYHLTDYANQFNPDVLIPLSVNACYGKNHRVELDAGETFASIVQGDRKESKPARRNTFHTFFSVGYRYHKSKGGINFRCAYTPIIERNRYYRHWAGISIGYSF